MSDDTIRRLFEKVDTISERLARLDAHMIERERRENDITHTLGNLDKRMHELEMGSGKLSGIGMFCAWLVTTAIALYGIIK